MLGRPPARHIRCRSDLGWTGLPRGDIVNNAVAKAHARWPGNLRLLHEAAWTSKPAATRPLESDCRRKSNGTNLSFSKLDWPGGRPRTKRGPETLRQCETPRYQSGAEDHIL